MVVVGIPIISEGVPLRATSTVNITTKEVVHHNGQKRLTESDVFGD